MMTQDTRIIDSHCERCQSVIRVQRRRELTEKRDGQIRLR